MEGIWNSEKLWHSFLCKTIYVQYTKCFHCVNDTQHCFQLDSSCFEKPHYTSVNMCNYVKKNCSKEENYEAHSSYSSHNYYRKVWRISTLLSLWPFHFTVLSPTCGPHHNPYLLSPDLHSSSATNDTHLKARSFSFQASGEFLSFGFLYPRQTIYFLHVIFSS